MIYASRHPGLVPGSTVSLGHALQADTASLAEPWTPAQGRGDGGVVNR